MDDLQDKKKYESEIYQNWIDQGCFKPSYTAVPTNPCPTIPILVFIIFLLYLH